MVVIITKPLSGLYYTQSLKSIEMNDFEPVGYNTQYLEIDPLFFSPLGPWEGLEVCTERFFARVGMSIWK